MLNGSSDLTKQFFGARPSCRFCEDALDNHLEVGNGIMMNFSPSIWFEAFRFTGVIFYVQSSEVGRNLDELMKKMMGATSEAITSTCFCLHYLYHAKA